MVDASVKTDSDKKREKAAGLIACVFWVLGFALSFIIPGKSAYTWVPDTLLLVGFFPVLFVHPAGWTWFIFGILNAAIGFILEVGYQLPDEVFPPEVNTLRKGLQATHPTLVWILLGAACTLYGVFRITKTVVRFIRKRAVKSSI
jgi:hypothetical protein